MRNPGGQVERLYRLKPVQLQNQRCHHQRVAGVLVGQGDDPFEAGPLIDIEACGRRVQQPVRARG
jgi:hypothetical protein